MHIAEASDVHQEVKAQRRARMEGPIGFIVTSAMPQPQLDDLVDARCRERGHNVARLAVRMLTDRVDQRCGQFDLKAFGPFDKVHNWSRDNRKITKKFAPSLAQLRLRLDQVVVRLSVFHQRGRCFHFADN